MAHVDCKLASIQVTFMSAFQRALRDAMQSRLKGGTVIPSSWWCYKNSSCCSILSSHK